MRSPVGHIRCKAARQEELEEEQHEKGDDEEEEGGKTVNSQGRDEPYFPSRIRAIHREMSVGIADPADGMFMAHASYLQRASTSTIAMPYR